LAKSSRSRWQGSASPSSGHGSYEFGDKYREYMGRTGRFLPQALERVANRLPVPRSAVLRPILGFILLECLAVGGAFALRAHTVARLPLWSEGRVTGMTILPADAIMLEHRMPFADVDIHNLILVDIRPLGPGTGWGRVPTPMF